MPYFICPNCTTRALDDDGKAGLTHQPVGCSKCGFGYLFELLEDFFPPANAGFVACDSDTRVISSGKGVFELTGYREADLIGQDVSTALALSDSEPLELVREWGVRKLGQELEVRTRAGLVKPVLVDLFPAYDEDGGILVALSSR